MKTNMIWKLGTTAFLSGLVMLGCTDSDSDPTAPRPSLNQAWSSYESGQYADASASFQEALLSNDQYAEAWCGLGWSRAREHVAGGPDMSEGVLEAFYRADQYQEQFVDAWAGLAEYHNWTSDTLAAVEWALDAAEQGGASYVFEHETAVSHRSLRKIAAWNLFKLNRFDEAAGQVEIVQPGFQWRGQADSLEVLFTAIGNL